MPHFLKIDGEFTPVTPLVKAWYGFKFVIGTDIFILNGDLVLAVGETRLLDVSIDGENPQGATFGSNDPLVATVDTDGLVTGIAEGQAVISATTIEEPTVSHSITVSVGTYEFGIVSDAWTFTTE